MRTWTYENRALALARLGNSIFDHREICSSGGTVVVIHWNLNMGAVEARKGTLDPKSIATLPDKVLLRG